MKYLVAREHLGDRMYLAGETREANPADVEHLLANGVLVEAKAERPLKNKAEPPLKDKAG